MLLGKDLIKIVTHAPLQFCSSKYHQHGFCASSIGTDMPLYIYVLREVNLCFFLEDSLFLGGLSEEKNTLFVGGGGYNRYYRIFTVVLPKKYGSGLLT